MNIKLSIAKLKKDGAPHMFALWVEKTLGKKTFSFSDKAKQILEVQPMWVCWALGRYGETDAIIHWLVHCADMVTGKAEEDVVQDSLHLMKNEQDKAKAKVLSKRAYKEAMSTDDELKAAQLDSVSALLECLYSKKMNAKKYPMEHLPEHVLNLLCLVVWAEAKSKVKLSLENMQRAQRKLYEQFARSGFKMFNSPSSASWEGVLRTEAVPLGTQSVSTSTHSSEEAQIKLPEDNADDVMSSILGAMTNLTTEEA